MNFLESKGVKLETISPIQGMKNNRELSPESYRLHIGDDDKLITIDTTDETLYMQAEEIDPDDTDTVYQHLKSLRDKIDWLI